MTSHYKEVITLHDISPQAEQDNFWFDSFHLNTIFWYLPNPVSRRCSTNTFSLINSLIKQLILCENIFNTLSLPNRKS